jgi:hypothetical protein
MWHGQSGLLVSEHGIGAGRSDGIERANEGMRLPRLPDEICDTKRMSTLQSSGIRVFPGFHSVFFGCAID